MGDQRQTDHDADYLRHAFPVLVTYTQQVVLAVDIERLCRLAAADTEDSPRCKFLEAMRDFVNTVAEIDRLEGLDP